MVEAGELLLSPRGRAETLRMLTELVVPELADLCAIDLLIDGRFELVGVAHADPSQIAVVTELSKRWPPTPEDAIGTGRVLQTQEPALLSTVTDDMLAFAAQDDEHLRLMRKVGIRSLVQVPLADSGTKLGVLSLANAESQRRLGEDDLSFAGDLARRAAAALAAVPD